MPYFLADRPLHTGLVFQFQGDEARHLLQSRRIRAGETFALQGPDGKRFSAEILSAKRHQAEVRVNQPLAQPALPDLHLTLLQATVKEKAAELILQKTTELGVARVIFFPSEHSANGPRGISSPRQIERWERIAWEACKQSDRAIPPEILLESGLSSAHRQCLQPDDSRFILHPGAAVSLGSACVTLREEGQSGVILIGPEGGFSGTELKWAQGEGYVPVGLGKQILRAETAALAACAIALFGG